MLFVDVVFAHALVKKSTYVPYYAIVIIMDGLNLVSELVFRFGNVEHGRRHCDRDE